MDTFPSRIQHELWFPSSFSDDIPTSFSFSEGSDSNEGPLTDDISFASDSIVGENGLGNGDGFASSQALEVDNGGFTASTDDLEADERAISEVGISKGVEVNVLVPVIFL